MMLFFVIIVGALRYLPLTQCNGVNGIMLVVLKLYLSFQKQVVFIGSTFYQRKTRSPHVWWIIQSNKDIVSREKTLHYSMTTKKHFSKPGKTKLSA